MMTLHAARKKQKTCHLLIVNNIYNGDFKDENELIQRYIQMHMWAIGCHLNGMEVSVFQRFHSDLEMVFENINYIFLHDRKVPFIRFYQIATDFNRKVGEYASQLLINDVRVAIHINGMIFPASTLHLRAILSPSVDLFLQNHAERPGNMARKMVYRLSYRKIKGFFFTTYFHAAPWIKAKILDDSAVAEVMECTSACVPKCKREAKERLGIERDLLILWTGNLNANKDPLTILHGFKAFLDFRKSAKLYMLYRETYLLDQVKNKCRELGIENQVVMVGEVCYRDISDYYNAADIFVQGSYCEGSGVAVIDAMCCGAIPVVTKIPSFEEITMDSGYLWRCGDREDLSERLVDAASGDLRKRQVRCREIFQKYWSREAIGRKAYQYYFYRSDQTICN